MRAFGRANELEEAIDTLARAARQYEIEWPSPKFLNESLPRLREHEASPSYRGTRLFLSAILGTHPLARQARADDIAAVSKQQIGDFLTRTLAPDNAVFIVVGDFEPARARTAISRVFSDWRSSSAFEVRPPSPAIPQPPAVVPAAASTMPTIVARPGATQAEIIQGCLLPPSDAEIDALYDIAAQALAAEMHVSFREELGAGYDISGRATSMVGGTAHLRVDAAIGNDGLAATLSAIQTFWEGIRKGSLSTDSVVFEQVARLRDRVFELEHSGNLARRVFSSWLMRWPLTTTDTYASQVSAIRPADVDRVLGQCAAHLVLTITGDETVIAAAIQRAAAPANQSP
jgi:predicted Zn-dependent peptidase